MHPAAAAANLATTGAAESGNALSTTGTTTATCSSTCWSLSGLHHAGRRTLGLLFLLITVTLFTTSNFLASVGAANLFIYHARLTPSLGDLCRQYLLQTVLYYLVQCGRLCVFASAIGRPGGAHPWLGACSTRHCVFLHQTHFVATSCQIAADRCCARARTRRGNRGID